MKKIMLILLMPCFLAAMKKHVSIDMSYADHGRLYRSIYDSDISLKRFKAICKNPRYSGQMHDFNDKKLASIEKDISHHQFEKVSKLRNEDIRKACKYMMIGGLGLTSLWILSRTKFSVCDSHQDDQFCQDYRFRNKFACGISCSSLAYGLRKLKSIFDNKYNVALQAEAKEKLYFLKQAISK